MKKIRILLFLIISLLLFTGHSTNAETCWGQELQEWRYCYDGIPSPIKETVVTAPECMWIKLNTNIPFIGNCIKTYKASPTEKDENATTPINAFPKLIGALMSLLMTIILLMSFIMIIWSWVLMTMSWADTSNYTKWFNLLKRVATWMALLWASWVILKVINPNFFI